MYILGDDYDVFYTGEKPSNLRIHLLNSDKNNFVGLNIYFGPRHRMDVYMKNKYILPLNARFSTGNSGDILYVKGPTHDTGYFKRRYDSNIKPSGFNLYTHETRTLSVVVRGPVPIDIKENEVSMIELGVSESVESSYYDNNLIVHLAKTLGIPLSHIRVVHAVSEKSRKKRDVSQSDDTIIVLIEVGNYPTDDGNDKEIGKPI